MRLMLGVELIVMLGELAIRGLFQLAFYKIVDHSEYKFFFEAFQIICGYKRLSEAVCFIVLSSHRPIFGITFDVKLS